MRYLKNLKGSKTSQGNRSKSQKAFRKLGTLSALLISDLLLTSHLSGTRFLYFLGNPSGIRWLRYSS